jgi:two-component system chemotaxis response regulator CheB
MIQPVRVLVVDDSALMRKLIPQIIETDSSIQVVGTAMDGNFGLKKIEELNPQVVTLDLEMPRMGGLDMLKEIMRRYRLPVIVVSSHSTEGASVTLQALAMGAFDFIAKPSDVSARMPEIARDLISKIKAAAQSRGVNIPIVPGTLKVGDKRAPDLNKQAPSGFSGLNRRGSTYA